MGVSVHDSDEKLSRRDVVHEILPRVVVRIVFPDYLPLQAAAGYYSLGPVAAPVA